MDQAASPDRDPAQIERERAVANARLAAIVESSDDAIVSKNLDGIVMSWNKSAERIFGWTAEEMIGQPITKIIPADRQHEEPQILARLRRGERVDHFETIRQRKDGTLINISVTISPIRDNEGRIVGASKVARDITLQKRIQQELERAKEAAESANRAKDHFLSVLSHELRTPLTPVLGAVSLMSQDPTLPPQFAQNLEMIRRNVETEARLVDDLLDLTRIARGKVRLHFEVVDAHAVIRSVVSMFQPQTDERALTLTLALHARRHHVWADSGRFQQVLLNLMSNAVKFTPEQGSITVRTSNENGTVSIEVTDSGVGIEPDVMPRLFRAFEQGEQTTTRQFGGLGLGLSIVKSLVEMHRGSISATSEGRGRGATFTLRLDVVESTDPSSSGAPATSRPTDVPRQQRVLLVEDHSDTRQILALLLRSLGCAVVAVGSVREAMEAVDRQPFDLLLSDIGLPDGSGMDVMRHVQSHHSLKGIALSGFGQDDDMRRSREAGFSTHLIKPVSIQALREALRTVSG